MSTTLQNSAYKIKAGTIKNLGLVLPEPGAIVLNEYDGFVYIANDFGWVRIGATEAPFHFFFEYDGTNQFEMLWKAPSTSTITWDWGDNTSDDIAGNDATYVTTNSAYTSPGTYYVQLTGDVLDLTNINLPANPGMRGSINNLGRLTNLEFLGMKDVDLIGSLDYLDSFTAIEMYFVDMPNLTGDVGSLKSVEKNIQVQNCPLTTFGEVVEFVAKDTNSLVCVDNGWTSTEVDNLRKSALRLTNGVIEVHHNAYRTPASDDDIVTLAGAGNAVVVDEVQPLQSVGPELMVVANAVSDSAGNEIGGIAGWTPTGLGTPNIFESQGSVVSVGVFAFKIDGNPVPTAGEQINIAAPVTTVLNDIMRFGFDFRHLGLGERWQFFRPNAGPQSVYLNPEWTEWNKMAYYFKAPGTEFSPRFQEKSTSNNGGVYLDNFSLKKVL